MSICWPTRKLWIMVSITNPTNLICLISILHNTITVQKHILYFHKIMLENEFRLQIVHEDWTFLSESSMNVFQTEFKMLLKIQNR